MEFSLIYKVGNLFKYKPQDVITANSNNELIEAVKAYTRKHKGDIGLNLPIFSSTRIECDICHNGKRIGGYSFRMV